LKFQLSIACELWYPTSLSCNHTCFHTI